MTVTYPHDRPLPQDNLEGTRDAPFIPVYARTGRGARGARKGGLKTWMILAPIGVLVLGAGAAAMMMGGEGDVAPAPLVEPAATAPVLPPQPVLTEVAPTDIAPAPIVEAAPAPAPVARRAQSAPARRAAPAPRAAAPAPAATPRVTAPTPPASPQPYTSSLNTAPTATPAPATPAPAPAQPPVIVIQPPAN